MNGFRGTLAVVIGVALTGCAVGPNYVRPTAQSPAAYVEAPAQGVTDPAALATWWRTFADAELTALIERTIASNLDIQLAQARLREARATLRHTQTSTQWPTVEVNASATWGRTNAQTQGIVVPSGNSTTSTYQLDFDASWELDLFGGVRRQVEASEADAQAAEDALRNTLVSALAEVAKDYVQLRQYQNQLAVAQARVAAWRDTLRITTARNRAGLVADGDVASATANLAAAEAAIPPLESIARQTIHALAVLLGQQPGTLTSELAQRGATPQTPKELPLGLPADLLRRRPDVRQAERTLAASTARIGVEVANLFPKISLTGQFGGQSGGKFNLVDAAARYYTLGPTIQWGILNYPAIQANIRTAEARRDQQFLTYQQTVLTAFKEVEDALVAYTRELQRQSLLNTQVEEYRRAANIALAKYTRGLTTFLEVLEAQRSLYASEDAQAESQATLGVSLIALYKALGGGWEAVIAEHEG